MTSGALKDSQSEKEASSFKEASTLPSGTCEVLKWIALIAMLIDHVNAIFYGRTLDWATPVGRIAMPIFTILIGYNLARPRADHLKFVKRLIAFGLIATPFQSLLFATHGSVWWPLNIMFTFAFGIGTIVLLARRQWVYALSCLVLGGLFVDYLWFGIVLLIASWWFFSQCSTLRGLVLLATLAGLCFYNGNIYPMLAIPVIYGVRALDPRVRRIRWLFWTFYPAHLAALWVIREFLVK